MVVVDVPSEVAERLNTASARRRWYPFDRDVIDWGIPLDDQWAYMPAGHSVLGDSGVLERLGPADRSFLERWEMAQLMRNVAHGEHMLNQGILAMLWQVDPYNPSYRYLLHEVAEECQHMAMFNQWIRLNGDIETVDAREAAWSKAVADLNVDLAVRLPEAFWVNVLLFEFVGDEFNQAMRAEPAVGDDGRPLHPILVSIGRAHVGEEARHISYARRWLQQGMALLDDAAVREVQTLASMGVHALVDRGALLPVHFTAQLEPYMSEEEFNDCLGRSPARRAMLRQLEKLLGEFASLRVVKPETLARWQKAGAFG